MNSIFKKTVLNLYHISKGYPPILNANILLTNKCTQNCLQCSIPQQKLKQSFLPLDNAKQIIDKLNDWGTHSITISGGEPMLHPHLKEIINYAKDKNFTRIHLLTTLYGPDKLVEKTIDLILETGISISCSFDGFDDTADELRGAKNVSKIVMKNMIKLEEKIKKQKKMILTGVNIAINELNAPQIIDIIKFVEDLGWSINLDIYRWLSENHLENEKLKFSSTDKLKNILEYAIKSKAVVTPDWLISGYISYFKNNFKKICPYLVNLRIGSKFFINPDGEVFVCMNDSIGNIIHDNPEEIFKSSKWKLKIEEFKKCRGCWNTCYTLSAKFFSLINKQNIKRFIKFYSALKSPRSQP